MSDPISDPKRCELCSKNDCHKCAQRPKDGGEHKHCCYGCLKGDIR